MVKKQVSETLKDCGTVGALIEELSKLSPETAVLHSSGNPEHSGALKAIIGFYSGSFTLVNQDCRDMMDGGHYTTQVYRSGGPIKGIVLY